MTTHDATFTSEEICERATGNVNGFSLGIIAILKQQGASVEDAFISLGRLFAPGWEEIKGKGAAVAAREAALNMASGSMTIESISGDEREAQMVGTGWPHQDLLGFLHLTQSDLEPFWSIFQPIAETLNLDYRHESDGDRVTLTFTQR
ncbi:MAG: hypothetical protein NVS4B2_34880 [Chloroflexota bacterium]